MRTKNRLDGGLAGSGCRGVQPRAVALQPELPDHVRNLKQLNLDAPSCREVDLAGRI
jgi:hypothetical protein